MIKVISVDPCEEITETLSKILEQEISQEVLLDVNWNLFHYLKIFFFFNRPVFVVGPSMFEVFFQFHFQVKIKNISVELFEDLEEYRKVFSFFQWCINSASEIINYNKVVLNYGKNHDTNKQSYTCYGNFKNSSWAIITQSNCHERSKTKIKHHDCRM